MAVIHLKVTGADGLEHHDDFPPLMFVLAMFDYGADLPLIDEFADTLAAGKTVRLEGGACPLFEYRFAS